MTALRAFSFLAAATFRNRVRRQLQRLRKPRHIAPVAAGMLYFGWAFFGQRSEGRAVLANALAAPGAEALVALAVAARASTWWLFGADRSALAFTPAEVHFLFPAPLQRRDLLQYRLLSAQLRMLVSILLLAFISRRGPSAGVSLLRGVGLWMLLTTLHLHRLGASLARAGAAEHGRVGLRRNVGPLAIAGAGAAALGWAAVGAVRGATFATDPFGALQRALDTPPAAAALFTFRLIVRPAFAPVQSVWLEAAAPAALVLVLHYMWVLRSGVAFENAAVEASAQAAERTATRRGGAARQSARVRRPRAGGWIPLAATGAPLAALVWKNVLAAFRTLPLTPLLATLAAVIPVTATLAILPEYSRQARVVGTLALVWAGGLVAFGPQIVRNDLRQDLPRLALLRTFPLAGREVMLAQLGASTLVLTALGVPALLIAYFANLRSADLAGGPLARAILLAVAVVALPVVNALALTVQNAAALLFPSWVRLGPTQRATGIETSGQNMLVTLLSLTLLALLLFLPVGAAAAVIWALRSALGAWAVGAGLVAGLAVALGELWYVLGWLGGLFERTEPSEIG